jgi:acyl carrier protein
MTIEEVVGKTFNVSPHDLSDASSRETIGGWDSMGHITLIMELEQTFKVSISIDDAMEMFTVGNIKDILNKYGVCI